MIYTDLTLIILGMLGILLHNFIKMNEINKTVDGGINLKQYFQKEIFAIFISLTVVAIAFICKKEVSELDSLGKWLGLGFATIGYSAQSLAVKWLGKAEKKIDENE